MKEDSECHHIFFRARGVTPELTADAHKGRLCIQMHLQTHALEPRRPQDRLWEKRPISCTVLC